MVHAGDFLWIPRGPLLPTKYRALPHGDGCRRSFWAIRLPGGRQPWSDDSDNVVAKTCGGTHPFCLPPTLPISSAWTQGVVPVEVCRGGSHSGPRAVADVHARIGRRFP